MEKLVVLWKSDHIIDIEEMITPYILASKRNKWWDEIDVIIWGGSQKIVSTNLKVQKRVKLMISQGIHVCACKKCAEDLNVKENLEALNINVIYTGELLTQALKSDAKVITL